ncbi:hypothetical protein IDSA_06945 [Pseudidiomarina salinarum]|uniref:DUF420 domain-containing protein n=1 Tax=Pseudidiomarina salinarum TaxID=435908 RepID=A0A094IT04_9GAMM|nr:hypothetical protein [Pseudidiomarina salinarum]KFZ30815.1 hypothetical protein IDSA_06945 [Pseudidiomarina salinarum]RUO71284.1 hypothetical protein CWI79_07630 [Pseudidiomarina salinarum]
MKTLRAHPLHLFSGLLIWAVYYVVLYGGQGAGCAIAPPPAEAGSSTWLNAVLLLHTLVFATLLLYLAWLAYRSTPAERGNARFLLRTSAALYLLAAVATLAIGLPSALLPPCV